MDKQLIDIISVALSVIGLIGMSVKYNSPNLRRTYYGENLYAVKADIIDQTTIRFFTTLAIFGLLLVLASTVYGNTLPSHLYDNDYYLRFIGIAIISGIFLFVIFNSLSRRVAKFRWFPVIVKKLRPQYLQAVVIYKNQGQYGDKHECSRSEQNDYGLMQRIIVGIETHLEISSPNENWEIRLNLLKQHFEKHS